MNQEFVINAVEKEVHDCLFDLQCVLLLSELDAGLRMRMLFKIYDSKLLYSSCSLNNTGITKRYLTFDCPLRYPN